MKYTDKWLRPIRQHCYRQLLKKMSTKRGKEKVWLTVVYNPAWDSERAAVDEIIKQEHDNG